ncbi:DUF1996 domain-containing protein [Streptomyces chumphonensis]|uniref:DUF1996 domain-containing protein n=1 Tax=Streptomyces chumphonensis TaxID=1214925 RepID=UPI003D70FFDE
MRKQGHQRSRRTLRTVAGVCALVLGGGGTAVVAGHAVAGFGPGDGGDRRDGGRGEARRVARTIDCPDVGMALREVPESAKRPVGRELAALDAQIAHAYERLNSSRWKAGSVLAGLERERGRTIGLITSGIERAGGRAGDLERMSRCGVQRDDTAEPVSDGARMAPWKGVDRPGGPVPEDFVDIRTVRPSDPPPRPGDDASTGTFTTECGTNGEEHFNADNVIANPGVANGAHHVHDYVGNLATDAFSDDEELAGADTTCENGDRSSHYWPVLRQLDGRRDDRGTRDGGAGGHLDGNLGTILRPADVDLTFRGSPVSEVIGMPRFLRIITGDAKAFTNGTDNANASWSCTGFEDRQLTDRYPICPDGSRVVRTFAFQSCWDGENTDSANHRTHVAFAEDDGGCPDGFRAIPQLVQRVVYDVPPGAAFAVDSFPEQLHKPVTDHSDFINVMDEDLMRKVVACVNGGRDCG